MILRRRRHTSREIILPSKIDSLQRNQPITPAEGWQEGLTGRNDFLRRNTHVRPDKNYSGPERGVASGTVRDAKDGAEVECMTQSSGCRLRAAETA